MGIKKRYEVVATCYDKRGRILSKGTNSYTHTHPIQAMYAKRAGDDLKVYLHAEVLAIIKARGKPIHKIKVERYDQTGLPRNACPCRVCQLAIKEAGIKVIEYTI